MLNSTQKFQNILLARRKEREILSIAFKPSPQQEIIASDGIVPFHNNGTEIFSFNITKLSHKIRINKVRVVMIVVKLLF